jgi:glycosyltransferase involved in cell wall biosynthesis
VLVLLTEPSKSPWLEKIPNHVDVIDYSAFLKLGISEIDHLNILSRLIMQLNVNVLHIINSRHAWEMLARFGKALSHNTKIFASLYCDDLDEVNRPVGYARRYLYRCYKNFDFIFSDNTRYPLELSRTYGFDTSLFVSLRNPTEITTRNRRPKGRRVLWAGRLDRQKRPDILLSIAIAIPDIDFFVYGEPILNKKGASSLLRKLGGQENIHLMGEFDGSDTLPFDEFPAYLYTSQWDGLPNLILHAAASSIPIVASCVGGVGDVVTEERGFPIYETENISEYVSRLLFALDNPLIAEARAIKAQEYVMQNHTWEQFSESLQSVPGYLPRTII